MTKDLSPKEKRILPKATDEKSFPTAEDIMDFMTTELDDFVNGLPISKKREKLKDDFAKVSDLLSAEKTKLADVDKKLTVIQGKITASSVNELPAISGQKAKILSEKKEMDILLNDLSERQTAIEKELTDLQAVIQTEVRGFLQTRRIAFEQSLAKEITDRIEPLLEGWNKFSKTKNCFLEIKLYSPLVAESCKNVLSPIRYD